jgi:hypothetical protein
MPSFKLSSYRRYLTAFTNYPLGLKPTPGLGFYLSNWAKKKYLMDLIGEDE